MASTPFASSSALGSAPYSGFSSRSLGSRWVGSKLLPVTDHATFLELELGIALANRVGAVGSMIRRSHASDRHGHCRRIYQLGSGALAFLGAQNSSSSVR